MKKATSQSRLRQWVGIFFDGMALKFMMAGTLNTILGTSIMFGLHNLAGWGYWASSAFSYGVAGPFSFFLAKFWVFRGGDKIRSDAIRYLLNLAVAYLLAFGIAKPLVNAITGSLVPLFRENLALSVGMVLYVLFNYLGQRFFVFINVASHRQSGTLSSEITTHSSDKEATRDAKRTKTNEIA